jgi:hypothetical protein
MNLGIRVFVDLGKLDRCHLGSLHLGSLHLGRFHLDRCHLGRFRLGRFRLGRFRLGTENHSQHLEERAMEELAFLEAILGIVVYPHLDMDRANMDTCCHYQYKLGNPPFSSDNLLVYTCTSFLFYFFNFPFFWYMQLSANTLGQMPMQMYKINLNTRIVVNLGT